MEPDIEILEAAARARTAAVITGAGISGESGIPTFRGEGGLWNNYRAEELATPQAFGRDPELVWRWYDWRRGICAAARPNPAHHAVVAMEQTYSDFMLITQNVDGLHGRAGSRKLKEIHGNIWEARCTACRQVFDIPDTPLPEIPVHCPRCRGLARPHIVWFGESYDDVLLREVLDFIARCDFVFVIGTSGMVSMPVYLASRARDHEARILEINPNESEISALADAVIRGKAGESLPPLWEKIVSLRKS